MEFMRYETPASVEAAAALLCEGGARVLAGGTDLLVQMRSGLVEPTVVVDVKHLPETREITAQHGGFRVGAAVSGAELGEHPEVRALWPGVVESAELIGSTQIQGPRLDGRQPLQRLACRRHRAGADRGARHLHHRGAARHARGPGGSGVHRPRADQPGARGVRGVLPSALPAPRVRAMRTCASFPAPRWTSRWWEPRST